MGCGSSTATAVAPEAKPEQGVGEAAPIEPTKPAVYPPAEAFEVTLDNEAATTESGSIIKRHPPKRLLQRLAEAESPSTTTTIEDLQEKLANAELRRNKFLQQRVDRIKEADDTESMDGGNEENNNNSNMEANKKSLHKLIDDVGQVEQQIADEAEPPELMVDETM